MTSKYITSKVKPSWSDLLDAHEGEVERATGLRVSSIVTEPKFIRLRNGSIPDKEFSLFGGLVLSDLSRALVRMASLSRPLHRCLDVLDNASWELQARDSDGLLANFVYFAEDLARDVGRRCADLEVSVTHERDLRRLSEVHDTLVAELPRFEVATAFVEQVMSDLEEVVQKVPC